MNILRLPSGLLLLSATMTRAALIFHATLDNADVGAGLGTDTSASSVFQVRDTAASNHGNAGNVGTSLTATVASVTTTGTNHVTSGAAGQIGQALGLSPAGVADNRAINFGDVDDVGVGSFSVSFWMNASTNAAIGLQFLMSKGNTGSGTTAWSVFLENQILIARVGTATTNRGSQSRSLTDTGAWHLITLTLDSTSGTVTGYLDGSNAGWTNGGGGPAGNTITAGTNLDNTTRLVAGIRADGAAEFLGRLDDLAIWNSALTHTQVNTLYLNGLNGINAAGVPEPGSLLLAGGLGLLLRRRRAEV